MLVFCWLLACDALLAYLYAHKVFLRVVVVGSVRLGAKVKGRCGVILCDVG